MVLDGHQSLLIGSRMLLIAFKMFGIVVNHSQFSLSQHWKRHGFNVTMRSQGCLLSPSDDIFTDSSFVRSPFRCLGLNNIAIFLMSCLGGFAREFIRSIEHGLHVSKHVNHSVHIKSNLEQSVVILLKSLLDSRNFLLHFLLCSVLEASFALLLCLQCKPVLLLGFLELRYAVSI